MRQDANCLSNHKVLWSQVPRVVGGLDPPTLQELSSNDARVSDVLLIDGHLREGTHGHRVDEFGWQVVMVWQAWLILLVLLHGQGATPELQNYET